MAKKALPKATHEGKLKIGELVIECAVLDDGRRMLTQSDVMRALGRSRQAKGRQHYDGDVTLPAFLTAKNLKPFIQDDLRVTSSQVEFKQLRGGRAFGYPAELLPKICAVFIDAERAGALVSSQKHIAEQAHILIMGFATVGIVALVDEATGYQYDRARSALAEILEKFISEELLKWAKRFPDAFYEQLFRLRGWTYLPFSVKRPSYVGKLTNDLIYSRLAPGVLEKLKKETPRNSESGRLKHHMHRWFTEDIGHPRLQEHIHAVITLMKASSDWASFQRSINRALPKQMDQGMFSKPKGDNKKSR